jgi:NADH-quinone oxidoreductase subunit F
LSLVELRRQAEAAWALIQNPTVPQIFVGLGTCGEASGAAEVAAAIEARLKELALPTRIHHVGCLGTCYCEPMVDIIKPGAPRVSYHSLTPEKAAALITDYLVHDNPRPDLALGVWGESWRGIPVLWGTPMLKPQVRVALRNCGVIDPDDFEHCLARGGYRGLEQALTLTPEEVIAEVEKAGLRGRGGAGFPTATKWKLCRQAEGDPKYLICNADEGDPGAFMNRALLEGDPHAVLEGILIGAYAIGASQGFIYVRAEYPLAVKRLRQALDQMRLHGLLGPHILGSSLSFDLKLVEGAGAFVCGEETALIASIEGGRGTPRPRPPFPAEHGLWGQPTNINNVETWAQVPVILTDGAASFRRHGTEKSKGTKTLSLAGDVRRTGLIEVPLGTPLQQIIYDIGGGIAGDKKLKAVQTGGPSGGCLPAHQVNLPVDYEALAKAGSIMGSGGVIVLDEDACPVDLARYFLSFTEAESCGKCAPCRQGTRQMRAILDDIIQGKGRLEDIDLLLRLAKSIKAAALCGLGQGAPNPVLTTINYFREEYEAHIVDKRCPALVCKGLISYYIKPEACQACGICLRDCPAGAITGGKKQAHVIDQGKCTRCGTCLEVCPARFQAVVKLTGQDIPGPGSSDASVERHVMEKIADAADH